MVETAKFSFCRWATKLKNTSFQSYVTETAYFGSEPHHKTNSKAEFVE